MAQDLGLSRFFQGDISEDPGAAIQELMRAILIRTQFLPAVRHVIGWRGLKQSAAAAEGWTAKIRDHAGVFGLFFMDVEDSPAWATGLFGLCYFPDPEEAVVERYCLQAAAFTRSTDYWPCVRDFLQRPEMRERFGVGSLLLSVRPDQRGLALSMQGMSSQRTVLRDGVSLQHGGRLVQLVAPGGCDRDLPGFDLTHEFFDVLAASVTFNLEQPPACLIERRYSASQLVYDRTGMASAQNAPDLWNGILTLGYGEGDFEALCSAVAAAESVPFAAAKADGPDTAPGRHRDRLWWRVQQLKDSKSVDKKMLGLDERPPFIILTGFLGSGKTSFLQHFIEHQTQRSRFVAVIQNEIGEIGLDGKLLDYTVTEIDEGCVCCSLSGNLKRAVHGILESFSPDCVILETSGMANPLNLLDEMTGLEDQVRFDCTVAVVDALNFDESQADYRIAADQIRVADVLILNKCDLVGDARVQVLRRRLCELKPNAPVFGAVQGDVNPALIFDVEEAASQAGKGLVPASAVSGQGTLHQTHVHDGLWSRTIRFLSRLDRGRFLEAAESIPPAIFRAKGIIDVSDPPQTMLFQFVAGRYELSVFSPAPTGDRFLTLIGKGEDTGIFDRIEKLVRAAES